MALNVGDPAPAFSTVDETGKAVRSSDYTGKNPVVLVFIPKDDTPG